MARISIHRAHHLSHAKAKAAAETLAKDLESKFSLHYAWEGDHITFKRPGVTGRLRVAPAELELHVELGFLVSAFRSSIEQEIHRQLDEILAKEKAPPAKPSAAEKKPARTRAPRAGSHEA